MATKKKILAIDDNETNLAVLEEILSDDYELHTASSGYEALAKALKVRPDLVLLDIMMPGIQGYEVCRKIREMPEIAQTKVIMLSAKAMISEKLRGYETGADDYLTKPFDTDELLAKIRVYLRQREFDSIE